MRENIRKHAYLSRADFREHVDLIVHNSRIYNGSDNPLTKTAQQMLDYTDQQFKVRAIKGKVRCRIFLVVSCAKQSVIVRIAKQR